MPTALEEIFEFVKERPSIHRKVLDAVFSSIPGFTERMNEVPGEALQQMADYEMENPLGSAASMLIGSPGGALGSGGGAKAAKRAYEGLSDALMGFSKEYGKGKSFEEQAYKHIQKVLVEFPADGNIPGDTFEDAVKGLNKAHAVERARRNWPGAIITPID